VVLSSRQPPQYTKLTQKPVLAAWGRLARLWRFPTAVVGLIIVGTYALMALLGPLLAPYPYTEFHISDTLHPPSTQYLFGTDQFGRDIFSRVIVGSRNILVLATSATAFGLLLGITIGLIAGYYGGLLDEVLMRLMDVMMSFPSLLLALLILSMLGSALINVILGIAIVFMPRVARVVRSVVLGIKTREFVDAARVRGESGFYIMVREILPNATGPIIVEGSIRISYAILLGAALGFLGLGVQPPAPDWGLQVSEGRNFILAAPWVVAFPSLAIASLVVGVNLLADGLGHMMHISTQSWEMMPVVSVSEKRDEISIGEAD
jgi:peptide/nickel transport system permease protein